MKTMSNQTLVFISAFTTVLLWGSAFPCTRYLYAYYSPESLMFFRFIVASLFLGAFAVIKKMRLPKKQDFLLVFTSGFIGVFAYMWLFNTGTTMVQSGVSSFIISMSPVFTIILSYIFLKEKADIYSIFGVGISFIGLALIAKSQMRGFSFNFGTLLLVLAAVLTSVYSITQRKLLKTYTPIEAVTYCVLVATCCMFVFLPKLLREFPSAPLTANLVVVYLGVFPAAIAYFTWGYALSKARLTSQVQMFIYLSPFVASVIAYFWLGEVLSLLSLTGGVVIIAGMIVASRVKDRRKENPAQSA